MRVEGSGLAEEVDREVGESDVFFEFGPVGDPLPQPLGQHEVVVGVAKQYAAASHRPHGWDPGARGQRSGSGPFTCAPLRRGSRSRWHGGMAARRRLEQGVGVVGVGWP